jgi:hypothetical protein
VIAELAEMTSAAMGISTGVVLYARGRTHKGSEVSRTFDQINERIAELETGRIEHFKSAFGTQGYVDPLSDLLWYDVMGIPFEIWCENAITMDQLGVHHTEAQFDDLIARRDAGEFTRPIVPVIEIEPPKSKQHAICEKHSILDCRTCQAFGAAFRIEEPCACKTCGDDWAQHHYEHLAKRPEFEQERRSAHCPYCGASKVRGQFCTFCGNRYDYTERVAAPEYREALLKQRSEIIKALLDAPHPIIGSPPLGSKLLHDEMNRAELLDTLKRVEIATQRQATTWSKAAPKIDLWSSCAYCDAPVDPKLINHFHPELRVSPYAGTKAWHKTQLGPSVYVFKRSNDIRGRVEWIYCNSDPCSPVTVSGPEGVSVMIGPEGSVFLMKDRNNPLHEVKRT